MSHSQPIPDALKPGFRLQKLEVRNWGTFDGTVWKICPDGHNALLTGDIGSGKSTLVDALTTLLVPGNRITYNKAAGADARERSPYSYILGEYKNVQSEVSGSRKAQFLRHADKDYSVLLATFADEPSGQVVTLAQVFWIRENKAQKFFVVANGELSIVGDFGNFGTEMPKLRKRLRDTPGVELFDSFSEYAGRFSQLFGILQRETALDLFFQTVSMKSVGNLTDFVRNQMLGRTDVREKITSMTRSFDDLRQAHDTVRNVRDQMAVLQVLVNDQRQYTTLQAQLTHLQACRDAVPTYMAYLKVDLLKTDLHRQHATLQTLKHALTQLDEQILARQHEQTDLQVALKSNEKGRRIDDLAREIQTLEGERNTRRDEAKKYAGLVQRLGLPEATSAEQFFENQRQLPALRTGLAQQIDQLQQERDGLVVIQNTARKKKTDLETELQSLKGRHTKIPDQDIRLR